MYVARYVLTIVTAADGSATAYSGDTGIKDPVFGRVLAVRYVKPGSGAYTDGVSATITAEATGEAILTIAGGSMNASASFYPRVPTCDTAGAASLYAAAGKAVNDGIFLSNDRVKIVLAGGGNAATGTFHILVA